MEPARTAAVQVWGKGFRITADSEEFQRLVPLGEAGFELERVLRRHSGWLGIVEQLKQMGSRDLDRQVAVLLRPDHISVLAVGSSEDKYGRWSPVVVMASTAVDWSLDDIGGVVARMWALASRLAKEYAIVFRGARVPIQSQLKDGSFLPEAKFQLSFEAKSNGDLWTDVVAAVREWQGVTGVATPVLAALGANVVIGTKHEVSLISGLQCDGRYDLTEKRIDVVGTGLRRWPKKVEAGASPEVEQTLPAPDLRGVEKRLERMDNSLARLTDAVVGVLSVIEAMFGGGPRRK